MKITRIFHKFLAFLLLSLTLCSVYAQVNAPSSQIETGANPFTMTDNGNGTVTIINLVASGSGSSGNLKIFNLYDNSMKGYNVGTRLVASAFAKGYIFLINEDQDYVIVTTLEGAEVAKIEVGGRPSNVYVTMDTNKVFATNGDGSISLIDISNGIPSNSTLYKSSASNIIGLDPRDIYVDGNYIYLISKNQVNGNSFFRKLLLSQGEISKEIEVEVGADAISLGVSDNYFVIVNNGSFSVSLIDKNTFSTQELHLALLGAKSVTINKENNVDYAYVASFFDNFVAKINLSNLEVNYIQLASDKVGFSDIAFINGQMLATQFTSGLLYIYNVIPNQVMNPKPAIIEYKSISLPNMDGKGPQPYSKPSIIHAVVSTSCNNRENCYNSLTQAIQNIPSPSSACSYERHVIYIESGTYGSNEVFPIGSAGTNIQAIPSCVSLIGDTNGGVIIDGSSAITNGASQNVIQIAGASNILIEGLTVQNAPLMQSGIFIAGLTQAPTENITIRNNTLKHNGRNGFGATGVSNLLIQNNKVELNRETGITVSALVINSDNTYQYMPNASTVRIIDNISQYNIADGILVTSSNSATVQGNHAHANGVAGIEFNGRDFSGPDKRVNSAEAKLEGIISYNYAYNNGGQQFPNSGAGILVTEEANALEVIGNDVKGNRPYGIGVYERGIMSDSATLDNCSNRGIEDNKVESNLQGGIVAHKDSSVCKIVNNRLLANLGVGIDIQGSDVLHISNNQTISDGVTIPERGISVLYRDGKASSIYSLDGNTFNANEIGIEVQNSTVKCAKNNRFDSNTQKGLHIEAGAAFNTLCEGGGNSYQGNGAGIIVYNSIFKDTGATIANNTGTGIDIRSNATVILSNANVLNNRGFEGGVRVDGENKVTLNNNLIEGNYRTDSSNPENVVSKKSDIFVSANTTPVAVTNGSNAGLTIETYNSGKIAVASLENCPVAENAVFECTGSLATSGTSPTPTDTGEAGVPINLISNSICDTSGCSFNVEFTKTGFYVVTANLLDTTSEGFWGISFDNSGLVNTGGFNSGAVLKENGTAPGFMAFYLFKAEAVKLSAYEYTGNVSTLSLKVSKDSAQGATVFGPVQTASGTEHMTEVLEPGFYVVEALSQAGDARGRFGISVNAESMSGGVNIGGWIDGMTGGNGEGFGALYINAAQTVELKTFYNNTYGDSGANFFHVNVYQSDDNGRTLFFTSEVN